MYTHRYRAYQTPVDMRLSAAVTGVLAGTAFAAPTINATIKPKDAAIRLPLLHSEATESFAALQEAADEMYLYQYAFIAVMVQGCAKSRTETLIGFTPVFNMGYDKPNRPFPNSPVRLDEKGRSFNVMGSTFYAFLIKDVVACESVTL